MKKWIKSMSLVMSGVVLGVGISFSGDISAATSKLLGNKVGKVMTVTLDNKSIGEAPVIGGTSYVPVRTAANELGLEVNVSGNEVQLTTPKTDDQQNSPNTSDSQDIETQKEQLKVNISNLKVKIRDYENIVSQKETTLRIIESDSSYLKQMEESKARGSNLYSDSLIQSTRDSITRSKNNLDEAETSLPKLRAELADLESQLGALK